jgi:hypothetical protein
MKKIILLFLAVVLGAASISATSCPKGQHPRGGEGSHHKGGYCE